LFLVLSLGFSFPGAAAAQEAVQFSELVIEIWPEYDRPSALVIYRGILAPEVALPAQLTIEIPAEAGQPNAVAVRDASNQLTTVQYQRTVRGDTAEVTFTTSSQEIQFEYYDPGLKKSGDTRTYTYRWPGNHQVNAAVLQVQEPKGAEELEITPPLGNTFRGSDGLRYYYDTFDPLGRDPLEISLEYQKQGSALSFEEQNVQPSGPIDVQPVLSFQGGNVLPWILAGGGLLLLAGAVVLYWWAGSGRKLPAGLRSVLGSRAGNPDGGYCSRCGAARDRQDRFCRSCGKQFSD
jgi:hypothetical protein